MSTTEPGDSLPLVEQPPLAPMEVLAPPKPSPSTAAGRIQYLDSLRYVFSHPEWLKNFLIFAVFTLIPVLNTVLLCGYLYEIVEHRHRRLAGPYPLFQVRRFAAYMTRGIWCFFLSNIVGVIIAPMIQVLTQGTMFGSMAAIQSGDWGAVAAAVVIPLVIIGFLLFLLGLQVLITPFMLRGGLSQDFGLMMNFRWIGHYLQTMWLETILVCLFVLFSTLAMMVVGCPLLCVGLVAAIAFSTMVQAHLHCQLYELYLARGGEPIPLRPLVADVPPVIQSSSPTP
jgi:hypothetical protein